MEDNPFTGFLLCRVCPPTGRVLGERKPVLPMRTSGGGSGADQRLVFALCRSCANSGAGQSPPPCRHSKHQRSWVAAYTHFELNKALEVGYTVIDLYEVCFYRLHVSPPQFTIIRSGTMPSGQRQQTLSVGSTSSGATSTSGCG
jgi:hypothetical protein